MPANLVIPNLFLDLTFYYGIPKQVLDDEINDF